MKTITNATLVDYIWLLSLSAVWGSSFIAIELALADYDPFLLAFCRILIATIFLSLFVYFQKLPLPKDIKTWFILLCIGVLNNAMPFYFISWGQQYISASTASVMLAVGPFIALVLSHYFTHDEKFTIFKLIGVVLGFSGVFILLGEDFFKGQEYSLYGKIAMLLAVLGYISSGFLIRKISYVNTIVCSSSMLLTATIAMIPVLFFMEFKEFAYESSFLWIVYLAIFPTALASLVRVRLVRTVGVQFMSQVAYLIPIFAIFWSFVFFNEKPKEVLLVALVFIFLGLFIRKIK